MTSTTSSNKKSFSELYKWSLKRNGSIMLVFSMVMVLGILLDLYVMSQLGEGDYKAHSGDVSEIGMVSIVVAQVAAMIFSLISSVSTFSFLHNKRSTDMFGSLPATRETMFVSHLLGGITAVTTPFVIGSFVVVGCTLRATQYVKPDFLFILFGVLGIIAAYTFTALIAYSCGTIKDTVVVTLGVNVIYAGIIYSFWGIIYQMIPGIGFESIMSTPIPAIFTPFGFCLFEDAFYYDDNLTGIITLVIWSILFSAGAFIFALRTAKKRKAEVAQNEFYVKWLPYAVKAGASIVCGAVAGLIATSMKDGSGFSNMIVFVAWYVLVGLVASIILHAIFEKGIHFKNAETKNSVIVYSATTVAVIGLVFLFSTGLGIDTYVPSASNVKSVSLGYIRYQFKEPENVKTVTEIHKLICDGIKKNASHPYYISSGTNMPEYDYQYYGATIEIETPDTAWGNSVRQYKTFAKKYPLVNITGFSFTYHKKVGFTTYRTYYLSSSSMGLYDLDKIESLLQKLYNSDEYKHLSVSPVFWDEELRAKTSRTQAPTLSYRQGSYDEYGDYSTREIAAENLPNTDEFVDGLFNALQQDILADDEYYISMYSNDLRYTQEGEFMVLTVMYEYRNVLGYGIYRNYFSGDVVEFIPKSYENTINYLQSYGISIDIENNSKLKLSPTELVRGSYSDAYYTHFGENGDSVSLLKCVEIIAPRIEYAALAQAQKFDEIDDWDSNHGEEFINALVKKADELCTKYMSNSDNINPTYENSITRQNSLSGDYFYMADKIISDLVSYSVELVNQLSE